MDQGALGWHKSSYSGDGQTCVDQGMFPDGRVAVRDTKDQGNGPVLCFSPDAWSNFVQTISHLVDEA